MSTGPVCYVYIMCQNDGSPRAPVKVGIAGNIESRLKQIRTATPFPVRLYNRFRFPDREIARLMESAFHKARADHRVHGEWFNIDPPAAFEMMCVNVISTIYSRGFRGDELKRISAVCGVPKTFLLSHEGQYPQ